MSTKATTGTERLAARRARVRSRSASSILRAVSGAAAKNIPTVVGVTIALLSAIISPLVSYYAGQQADKATNAAVVKYRGAYNDETRDMTIRNGEAIAKLGEKVDALEVANSGFHGQMIERTSLILDMLKTEHDDRKSGQAKP